VTKPLPLSLRHGFIGKLVLSREPGAIHDGLILGQAFPSRCIAHFLGEFLCKIHDEPKPVLAIVRFDSPSTTRLLTLLDS
jgi:hypothetical protein